MFSRALAIILFATMVLVQGLPQPVPQAGGLLGGLGGLGGTAGVGLPDATGALSQVTNTAGGLLGAGNTGGPKGGTEGSPKGGSEDNSEGGKGGKDGKGGKSGKGGKEA